MEHIFSYGTLQKESVQLELFGRKLKGSRDVLNGYRICPIEISDPAFLSRGEERQQKTALPTGNPGDVITGTAYEVSEEELFRADQYEPEGFKRILVVLGSGRQAWLYEYREA